LFHVSLSLEERVPIARRSEQEQHLVIVDDAPTQSVNQLRPKE